jgi:RNA polymerase sigma factor (sigma-70 family)
MTGARSCSPRAGGCCATRTGPTATHSDNVDLRDALIRALGQLPARQRAVLVLRYWKGHSEAEVADLLACSVGTVKSTASRGRRRVREISGADLVAHISEGHS